MTEVTPSRHDPDTGGRRLPFVVGMWSTLALAVGVWTVVATWGEPANVPDWVVAGLFAACVVAGVAHVRVVLHGSTEAVTLSEVGVIPVVLLLPPHLAVVVGATAGLVAEAIITRGQVRKLVFNAAWQIVGLGVASWSFRALSGGEFMATPRPLVAALVAAASYVLVNLAAIAAVLAVTSGRRWTTVVVEEAVSSLLLGFGAAVVGIVAAVMVVEAPWALPFLVLPAVLYRGRARARSEGLAGLAAERDRFQRTVAGSSDGVVLLDPAGRVEVWNPAMAGLSGIDEARAVGNTLDELGWGELVVRSRVAGEGAVVETRITRGDRTMSVRASPPSSGGGDARTVLLMRDVSREAHLARLQEDLVTRVSHEIRTPLTTVMGLLDTLDRHWEPLPPDRRRELVRVASRGARRLGRLITNLESLARIEARTGETVAPLVDPVAEIGSIVDEVVNAPGRSRPPLVAIERGVLVQAAAEDVRLILENLLGNAELYGAPPVELSIDLVGDEVVMSVSDHGTGVPDDVRAQLFEPFAQGDAGLRRTTQGLGLGLAIVRSLAAASGGTVTHEEVPGGGSRFTVTLPAAHPV